MSSHHERVRLVLSDNFSEQLAALRASSQALDRLMNHTAGRRALRQATWEPHDWSDWEA